MNAFKSQQHRWAKGSIQTALKLLPGLLRSRLELPIKLEALAHLGANVGYVLMVLLSLLVVPSVWLRGAASAWTLATIDLPLFALSTLSVVGFYLVAEREALGRLPRGALLRVPFLMAVGIGLSINNARAVLEALRRRPSEFRRTPKYNLAGGERLRSRRYRTPIHRDTWIELGFAVHFAVATSAAALSGLWGAVPFLLLFGAGYGYTALHALAQSAQGPDRPPGGGPSAAWSLGSP
jgi:hypothetical protein